MFQQPNTTIAVCSISLNMSDKMRLIGVPANLIDGFRQALIQGWQKGIQAEAVYYGAHEFKFRGNPWSGDGDQSVWSRQLIVAVLTFMAQNGWTLLQSADLSKSEGDKDTMFFELGEPDPEAQIFSISFNMSDRIRVIGATGVMPIVKNAVQTHWARGIQEEREYAGALELKLSGNPWYSNGSDAVYSRILMNHILTDIRVIGFKLYGSIDINYGYEGRDLESWFFRKVGRVWA